MSSNRKYWSRDDVKNWIYEFKKNELLECGCEDPENDSLYGEEESYESPGYDLAAPYELGKARSMQNARCPETYEKTADVMIKIPEEVIEMLKPLMQKFNVGCPSSFAKAMSDVMEIAMDYDVVQPFKTEE